MLSKRYQSTEKNKCSSSFYPSLLYKNFNIAENIKSRHIYRLLIWHQYSLITSEMTLWSTILWLQKGTLF